ncbi:MAG: hypothetical protein K5989_07975 [Lachnospiraceae bacterium]|nr:hypothetical protein [Lachnospiraceae bacterium]
MRGRRIFITLLLVIGMLTASLQDPMVMKIGPYDSVKAEAAKRDAFRLKSLSSLKKTGDRRGAFIRGQGRP